MLDVQRIAIEFAAAGNRLAAEVEKQNRSLADQLSRATTSVALQLSEGLGRRTAADKGHKYDVALGECREALTAAEIAKASGYVDNIDDIAALGDRMAAMLFMLRRSLERW